MKLRDKVAIIIGSSKGIGKGIAQVFQRERARVVVVCRTPAEGTTVANELGAESGSALFVRTDVSDVESVRHMIRQTLDVFGHLDILVNNAGYHISKNVEETTEEEWDFIILPTCEARFFAASMPFRTCERRAGPSSTSAAWWASSGRETPARTRPARAGRWP